MIDITARYDSSNPMSKMRSGLNSSSMSAEPAIIFRLLAERFSDLPIARKENIAAARFTAGDRPVRKA